jgi:hypothetical protein
MSLIILSRYEAFMVMKINVEIYWVVTPYGVAVGYQHFRRPWYLHLQGGVNVAFTLKMEAPRSSDMLVY